MEAISITILLEYLYKKFVVTFILCLIGAFIKETIGGTSKQKQINPKRVLASSILASALMCAVIDYFTFSFSIYAVLTLIVGIWSPQILDAILSAKFMKRLAKNILKSIRDPIANAIADTVDETDKDKQKKKEGKEEKDDHPPSKQQ